MDASPMLDHHPAAAFDELQLTDAGGAVLRLAPWEPGGHTRTGPDDMHALYDDLAMLRAARAGRVVPSDEEPPPAA